MRFRLLKRPADVVNENSGELYAVIWTTTPWSLLANRAICYNAGDDYTVLEWEGDQYMVSATLVDSAGVKAALPGARPVVSSFPGRLLKGERALVKCGVRSPKFIWVPDAQLCSLAETPQPILLPPAFGLIYEGAIGQPR